MFFDNGNQVNGNNYNIVNNMNYPTAFDDSDNINNNSLNHDGNNVQMDYQMKF